MTVDEWILVFVAGNTILQYIWFYKDCGGHK
jgi:hypothetical protein